MRKLTIDTRYLPALLLREVEYLMNIGQDQEGTIESRRWYLTHWFLVMHEEN